MWQFVLCRASMMFAQAVSGNPANGAVPAESAPDMPPAGMPAPAGPGPSLDAPVPPQTSHFEFRAWHSIFLFVYFVVCVGLVVAVLLQTTKSEGLSGVIGGTSQSVFKGKKGFEDRLQEITNYLAIGFVVLSLIMSLVAFKV